MTRIGVILAGFCLALAAKAALGQDANPDSRPEPGSLDASAPAISAVPPVPRPPDLKAGLEISRALSAAKRHDWARAKRIAAESGEIISDIIEWLRLRSGDEGTFAEYRTFLAKNSDWPDLKLIRRRGEATIPRNAVASQVISYFRRQPPQTGYGVLRLTDALNATGQTDAAEAEIIRAWTSLTMTAWNQMAIRSAYANLLKPHHIERLDFALWQEDIATARRMLPLVGDDWKALATARLALQRNAGGVDELIATVPDWLADDPGLAHDRMQWRITKRRHDDAADLILEQSTSAKALGRPDAWATWRHRLARMEMLAGNDRRAYNLARNHFLEPGPDYADLEWLAGYIALRYLDMPNVALNHFRTVGAAVRTPISKGRARYWEGRALDALGRPKAAQVAYRGAAKHQTSFYGLLAAEKIGEEMDPALTGRDGFRGLQGTSLEDSIVVQAAGILVRAGESEDAEIFLNHLAEVTAEDDLEPLADYVLSLGDPHIALRIGKQIALRGVVAIRAYFPLIDLVPEHLPAPEALALSVARRESEFNTSIVSGAGARGLMQLMPATARQMARRAGIPYAPSQLTTDAAYNVTLGGIYLAQLIREFGNKRRAGLSQLQCRS